MKRLVLLGLFASTAVLGLPATPEKTPAAAQGGIIAPTDSKIREAALSVSPASPAFLKLHDSSKSKFDDIQSLISQIESGKLLHDGDAQKLDKLMFDYANDLKAAFDQASMDAQDASKSKGQKGSVQSLKTFEDLAQQHEQASKTFEPRMVQIQSKLKTGEIKLDRPLLQKMSPGDLQEFKKFLAPSAFQEMERLHPDLMKGSPNKVRLEQAAEPELLAEAIPVPFSCRVADVVGNLIEETADASLAGQCIGTCLARNWTACVNCIISKGPAAINAWNTFVRCWNGAGTCDGWPWHWGNCLRKAACLAQLIARLA